MKKEEKTAGQLMREELLELKKKVKASPELLARFKKKLPQEKNHLKKVARPQSSETGA